MASANGGKGMGNINPQDPSTMGNLKLTIGRRAADGAPNAPFVPMPMMASGNGNAGNANNMQLQLVNDRLVLQGVTRLDAEYVILIPTAEGLVAPGSGPSSGKQQLGLAKTNPATHVSVEWKASFALFAVLGGMLSL